MTFYSFYLEPMILILIQDQNMDTEDEVPSYWFKSH